MLQEFEVQKYKERLLKDRGNLLREVEENSKPGDFGSDVSGSGEEEADEAEEQDNRLATQRLLKERLARIDSALQRIEEGRYGVCKKCGKEISGEVLDLVPESEFCENCK